MTGAPARMTFDQLVRQMDDTLKAMETAASVADAMTRYADGLAANRPVLGNIIRQLKWDSEAGNQLKVDFNVALNAIDTDVPPTMGATTRLRNAAAAIKTLHEAVQHLTSDDNFFVGPLGFGTAGSLPEIRDQNRTAGSTPLPYGGSAPMPRTADDDARMVQEAKVLIHNALADKLNAANSALKDVAALQWKGKQGSDPSPPAPPPPPPPGPPPVRGPETPKTPGGAKPNAKAPGTPGGGDQSAAGPGGGDPNASSPGAGDPNAAGNDPSQSGLNIPNPSSPDPNNPNSNLPTDPNLPSNPTLPTDPNLPNNPSNPHVPNIPKPEVPHLAGEQVVMPDPSTNPPSVKIPDLGSGLSPNPPTGGGPISLPTALPPSGLGSNQSRSGQPGTGPSAGDAPRPGTLAGEPTGAAANAGNRGGVPPMYPPPMGGMGAGRGAGGIRPGAADKAGGPELGGLGGPARKSVEEIGVPSGLRRRAASGRPTRPARRPRKAGAAATGSAADERGEVLDEQLWRVEPPAMDD